MPRTPTVSSTLIYLHVDQHCSLLEDAWEVAVFRSILEDDHLTRIYSFVGCWVWWHRSHGYQKRCQHGHSECFFGTGSIVMAHPVTGTTMDPPGSVANSNLRGSTTGSRSQYRRQQEEMQYRLPPKTIHTKKPSTIMKLDHDNDDASVYSQLTGSTMTFVISFSTSTTISRDSNTVKICVLRTGRYRG